MSVTEHAILHRRVKARYKGVIYESHPDVEFVEHIIKSELPNNEVNRSLYGTRIDGMIKVIIWGVDILSTQDHIELNGNILDIGKGDMYELIRILKNNIKIGNHAVYILRRLQVKIT